MKRQKSQDRPQAAQIDAIERCLKNGEFAAANQRLTRLQAAFPDFKPLHRLAYDVAWQSGNDLRAGLAAWQWCAASPNSVPAFEALGESSVADFPYLFLHTAERLKALGQGFATDVEALRAELTAELTEDEGKRMDLCRLFLANEKTAEARAFVADIHLPAAQNNVAQSYFAEGKIEQAEAIWSSILELAADNAFTLERLFVTRLWLAGKVAAQVFADRLLALAPANPDDTCRQLDMALMTGQPERADAIYRAAGEAASLIDIGVGDSRRHLHRSGALAAWRLEHHDEALTRLGRIDEDGEELFELRTQLMLCRITEETPEWGIGDLSQWWPIARVRSLHRDKFTRDDQFFERWQVTMPQPDYLAAVAVNGEKTARTLAIAALRYLARGASERRAAAGKALIALLALPCGPDAVRGDLHRWLVENDLVAEDAAVSLLVGGKVTEARSLNLTIHADAMEEESVLSAADQRTYEKVLDLVHAQQIAKALRLIEELLPRYPDYARVLTTVATLREAAGQPIEAWAPLIRHAAAVAPDYFFARTGLVKLLVNEGKLDEAREQLTPLLDLTEMHSSEWRALLVAQIAMARAAGDLPGVARLNAMLRDCQERFG